MAKWSFAVFCLLTGALAGSLLVGPSLRGQGAALTSAPKELTSYRGIVKEVLPAVVSIQGHARSRPRPRTEQGQQRRRGGAEDPFGQLPEEFRRFFDFDNVPFETPEEQPQVGFGSGFLIDPRGIVLTNYHVVGGADQVEVTLNDGRKFTSRDIHGDRKTDLAVVRLDTKEPVPYLQLGDSDAMEIGDRVLAVGAPFGLVGTVTAGIVSAKDRVIGINMYEDFLQTDAAINPGNSGGPLVNMEGRVIGINSAIKSNTGRYQGVSLAIPSNVAKSVIKDLETSGVVHRGYLGVSVGTLTPDLAGKLNVPSGSGVVVSKVYENSPAAKAGLQAGDVITAVDGKPIKDGRQLQHAVLSLPLNHSATLSVVRDGKTVEMSATILEQPESYGLKEEERPQVTAQPSQGVRVDQYGLALEDLSVERAQQLGYKEGTKGALVSRVRPNSPAADQGLSAGMLITRVEKQPVDSAQAARDALEKARPEEGVMVQVQDRSGVTAYRILKPEPATK